MAPTVCPQVSHSRWLHQRASSTRGDWRLDRRALAWCDLGLSSLECFRSRITQPSSSLPGREQPRHADFSKKLLTIVFTSTPCPGVVVQLLRRVSLFAPAPCPPRTAACQASLSFTSSWRLLRLMSIESVMPSNHLILSHPLLLPSIFPSIRGFSNESVLCISSLCFED